VLGLKFAKMMGPAGQHPGMMGGAGQMGNLPMMHNTGEGTAMFRHALFGPDKPPQPRPKPKFKVGPTADGKCPASMPGKLNDGKVGHEVAIEKYTKTFTKTLRKF
jgi:hypothetical protein